MKNRQPKLTTRGPILRISPKRILDTEELRKATILKEYADRGMARFKRLAVGRIKKAVARCSTIGRKASRPSPSAIAGGGFADTRARQGVTTGPVTPYPVAADPLEEFSNFATRITTDAS